MSNQKIPKPHHHLLAWIGIGVFIIIIGGFWILGLGDLFKSAQLSPSIVSDLDNEWERISQQSKETMQLFQKQIEGPPDADNKLQIEQKLKEIFSQTATAAPMSFPEAENVVAPTPTTTETAIIED